MSTIGSIIAIGGGGFGRIPRQTKIEKYILNQSSNNSPNIVFIPTASAEDTTAFAPKSSTVVIGPSLFVVGLDSETIPTLGMAVTVVPSGIISPLTTCPTEIEAVDIPMVVADPTCTVADLFVIAAVKLTT